MKVLIIYSCYRDWSSKMEDHIYILEKDTDDKTTSMSLSLGHNRKRKYLIKEIKNHKKIITTNKETMYNIISSIVNYIGLENIHKIALII